MAAPRKYSLELKERATAAAGWYSAKHADGFHELGDRSEQRLCVEWAAGRVYVQETQTFVDPTGINTVLARTSTGYDILTSYPTA